VGTIERGKGIFCGDQHRERGGRRKPHNINDHDALNADEVLSTIAGTMATLGNNHVGD